MSDHPHHGGTYVAPIIPCARTTSTGVTVKSFVRVHTHTHTHTHTHKHIHACASHSNVCYAIHPHECAAHVACNASRHDTHATPLCPHEPPGPSSSGRPTALREGNCRLHPCVLATTRELADASAAASLVGRSGGTLLPLDLGRTDERLR